MTYAIYRPDGRPDTYRDGRIYRALTFDTYDEALEFLNSDAYGTTEGYTVGIYIRKTKARKEASE